MSLMSSGGALSKDTQLFLSTVMAPMMQGELTGLGRLGSGLITLRLRLDGDLWNDGDHDPKPLAAGKCGRPRAIHRGQADRCVVTSFHIRGCLSIAKDQPDLGYLSTNTPPQGELWLRGPNVFQGYVQSVWGQD